ncbi:MAG: DUF3006 domain-containing protein [Sporomusa sp.]
MRIKAVIDRFETGKAVLLVGEQEISVNWPRKLLPEAQEGDILSIEISVDVEATQQAKAEIDELYEAIVKQQGSDGSKK